MANQSINVFQDRFTSLASPPKSWLLVLQTQPYLNKNDTLTVNEVDSSSVPTGRYMTAVCTLIHSGEFYNLPSNDQLYYFKNKSDIQMSYVPTIVKSNITQLITGNTANNIVYSKLLPAGTFQANDIFRYLLRINANNTATQKTFRVYFNTTNAIAGATLIQTWVLTTALTTTLMLTILRNMVFKNSLTSQEIMQVTGQFQNDEVTQPTGSNNALTINFNVNQYFIIAIQLANAGDSANLLDMYGYIIR